MATFELEETPLPETESDPNAELPSTDTSDALDDKWGLDEDEEMAEPL